MVYKLKYGAKSLSELDDAIIWYKDISIRTAANFHASAFSRLDEIAETPHKFGPIQKRQKYRRAKIKRFPYLIVFRVDEPKQQIFIISFFHEKRNPASLMKRLRK